MREEATQTDETETCILCGEEMERWPGGVGFYGHNAEPLANGRCCSDCNSSRVLPARLAEISQRKETTVTPDREQATEIAIRLLKFSGQLADPKNDPNGETLMLGICMFVGITLGSLDGDEERDFFCDAACGYARGVGGVLVDATAPRGSA